jgi:hypothetical protein
VGQAEAPTLEEGPMTCDCKPTKCGVQNPDLPELVCIRTAQHIGNHLAWPDLDSAVVWER